MSHVEHSVKPSNSHIDNSHVPCALWARGCLSLLSRAYTPEAARLSRLPGKKIDLNDHLPAPWGGDGENRSTRKKPRRRRITMR